MRLLKEMVFIVLLALAAKDCKCEADSSAPGGETLDRRIEIIVRSEFNVPPDYSLKIGTRKPSPFPGFDSISVSLTRNAKLTAVDFLISTDNKKLARLEELDLTNSPMSTLDLSGRPGSW